MRCSSPGQRSGKPGPRSAGHRKKRKQESEKKERRKNSSPTRNVLPPEEGHLPPVGQHPPLPLPRRPRAGAFSERRRSPSRRPTRKEARGRRGRGSPRGEGRGGGGGGGKEDAFFFFFPFSSSNGDPGLASQLHQRPVLGCPRRVVPASQKLAADKHPRDRARAGQFPQVRLDLVAVVALVELPDRGRCDPGLAQGRADGFLGLYTERAKSF